MRIPQATDLGWFSEAIHSIYAARTPGELATAAVSTMARRFEGVFTGCEEIHSGGGAYTLHGAEIGLPLPVETPVYLHDHPFMPRLHDMPPLAHVRGTVSRTTFERTDYFNGVARPMGWNDHAILRMQRQPSSVTLSVCRDKLFTSAECALLRLIQPHLDVSWQRVKCPRLAAGAVALPHLRLSADLRPLNLLPPHHTCLKYYFPDWDNPGRLPLNIDEWVVGTRRELHKGLLAGLPRVLVVAQTNSRLLLRYFPVPHSGLTELHLAIWHNRSIAPSRSDRLSPREQEVLDWIAEGKRDAEIGIILGLSSKTVSKHVEHVLAKLHVTNRTAATGWARRADPPQDLRCTPSSARSSSISVGSMNW